MEMIWLYQFHLIVVRGSTVGKSRLIRRFTEGRFTQVSDPTVGVDFFSSLVEIEPGKRIKLQIWDTAGQERFRSWCLYSSSLNKTVKGRSVSVHLSIRLSFSVSLCIWTGQSLERTIITQLVTSYSSTSHSFQNVHNWLEEAQSHIQAHAIAFLLVGHKCDLEALRQFTMQEAEKLAGTFRMCYVETSALAAINVEKLR